MKGSGNMILSNCHFNNTLYELARVISNRINTG